MYALPTESSTVMVLAILVYLPGVEPTAVGSGKSSGRPEPTRSLRCLRGLLGLGQLLPQPGDPVGLALRGRLGLLGLLGGGLRLALRGDLRLRGPLGLVASLPSGDHVHHEVGGLVERERDALLAVGDGDGVGGGVRERHVVTSLVTSR